MAVADGRLLALQEGESGQASRTQRNERGCEEPVGTCCVRVGAPREAANGAAVRRESWFTTCGGTHSQMIAVADGSLLALGERGNGWWRFSYRGYE